MDKYINKTILNSLSIEISIIFFILYISFASIGSYILLYKLKRIKLRRKISISFKMQWGFITILVIYLLIDLIFSILSFIEMQPIDDTIFKTIENKPNCLKS